MRGDEDDEDHDDGAGQPPLSRFEKFRRGNRRMAMIFLGIVIGLALAGGAATGFVHHRHHPQPPQIQRLAFVAFAAGLVAAYYLPDKRLVPSRRWLGVLWMDGWRDWMFLAAVAAAAFVPGYISTWF
jgi:hypothetical protein